jgi:signal transduction histidine kinase
MRERSNWIGRSLFWRIAIIFTLLLLLFALISSYIFSRSTLAYSAELNQELNRGLATHTAQEISPYIKDGKVNQEGMGDLMHSMMVINPNVEVYILDTLGSIISYMAPKKVVKLEKVDMSPIHKFLASGDKQQVIEGEDPRTPGECKIFSAAPIIEESRTTGYVYIVLASQKYVSATERILDSYILSISLRSILVVLLVSLILGLIAFKFFTRHLDGIVSKMKSFQKGELGARIKEDGGLEFEMIAETFNGMADQLQENIEGLQGVDRLRKELISNVSHDLRTPIASIQGYAETLEMKQGQLSPDVEKDYLKTIVKNTENLNRLVNGLFELSKLEAGQIDLQPSEFSLGELVHDVAAKYRLISQKQGISINTILEKGSSDVKADLSMIDRVLQNLIDNAIKFCSEGDYINIELDTASPDKVKVLIADSGQGISEENLPKIFDRYFKGKSTSNGSGTGLGLSIAQKIIHLHGSEISVKSRLAQGSTFSFELPKAQHG